ncbi:hypothetical protein R9X47_02280 [Wukongibacter baidiensis]|uniref:hypothetical protein n=1 Tax=Wukongibacter baidiensis TaxID=1723361 RepID=UPI003D7FB17D
MKYKKILFVILVIVVLTNIIVTMNRDVNAVIYENYVAKENDNKIVYTYEDDAIELSLRWINEEVTKGPYSLFLALEVKDDQIDEIYIDYLEISSSNEVEYQFKNIRSEPLVIYNVDKEDTHLKYEKANDKVRYYQFEDKFNFNFEGKEEFILKCTLRYKGLNINKEKDIEVKYEPHAEKINASIV